MSEWIAVTQALPEAGERVLVFSREYGHAVANTVLNSKGDLIRNYTDDEALWDFGDHTSSYMDGITHWMPLPARPDLQP